MDAQQKLRAKRWNERIRLSVTFFNITSIGMFGLSVIQPILQFRSVARAADGPGGDKFLSLLKIGEDFSVTDLIEWEAAGAALAMHIFAHILVGVTESEE